MRIATGIDIVSIERIQQARLCWGERFLGKIFTPKEQAQAKSRGWVDQHFAGKFASKEAIIKALAEFRNGQPYDWNDIEILNSADGSPKVFLHRKAGLIQKRAKLTRMSVSISHHKDWAVASAIVVAEETKNSN